MPQHIANLPKTGFEMSQSFGFTSSTGMLLPVYQDFLNPGEKVRFSGNLFSRTQPIVTAAMVDVDVYLDWFFVPASMLYTLFPSLMWMTDDRLSSFYDSKAITNFPIMDVNHALSFGRHNDGPMTDVSMYDAADYYYYGDCIAKGRFRLADHLGFNPFGVFAHYEGLAQTDFLQNLVTNPNVFPMYPLAYQAIYEKHYRLQERESFDPLWFNADLYTGNNTAYTNNADYSPFTLRYRARKNDYFMSNMPSPIMSGMSMLGSNGTPDRMPSTILSKIDNWLGDPSVQLAGNSDVDFAGNSPIPSESLGSSAGSVEFSGEFLSSGLSPANIRSVFAVEKLLRITGRAEKNYDAQVLAHFGWKVPHDVKHEISFLGSDVGILHIGEVVSDAETFNSADGSGAALGAIGGKGYISINGKSRSFTAPVHGVLMCIYSAVPRQRYFGGFDKQNSITSRLSFYQPEFDKLGSQPIFAYECEFESLENSADVIQGWQHRYSQWKRKYDRVSTAFMDNNVSDSVNQYSAWVLATKPYRNSIRYADQGLDGDNRDNYICGPHDLDNIMVMDYSSAFDSSYFNAPWLMFATDPFINDFHANVKKVSTMSKTGEPNLD